MWMWVVYLVVAGPRRSRTVFVNAAVVSRQGLQEGERTIVVEI